MSSKTSPASGQPGIRVLIVTMDTHLNSAVKRSIEALKKITPLISLKIFSATEYTNDSKALEKCKEEIAKANIIFVGMLFLENQFLPIIEDLKARREHCDALVCAVSAAEVVKLTKIGKFDMSKPASGPMAFIKKLKGDTSKKDGSSGERQMKMLRRVPKLLRFIPGTAQDLRAYFLCIQYWLGGSEDNMLNMTLYLASRYGIGDNPKNKAVFSKLPFAPPFEYPDVGVYHPRMKPRISTKASSLPVVVKQDQKRGCVGVLMLRSYLLANNTEHYDAVIAAFEVQGLQVIPAFAAGLDSRPAINEFFIKDGSTVVDAVVSLTGFSLVGGPAYNDAHAAEEILTKLDVPYIAAHPVEFQTLDQWAESHRGLLPVESTIMIAIPELEDWLLSPDCPAENVSLNALWIGPKPREGASQQDGYSEFNLNLDLWGYERVSGGNWLLPSQNLSMDICSKWRRRLLDQLEPRFRVVEFYVQDYQNIGVSLTDIQTLRGQQVNFKYNLSQRIQTRIAEYQRALVEYLAAPTQ